MDRVEVGDWSGRVWWGGKMLTGCDYRVRHQLSVSPGLGYGARFSTAMLGRYTLTRPCGLVLLELTFTGAPNETCQRVQQSRD